jgi:hypothetical protein
MPQKYHVIFGIHSMYVAGNGKTKAEKVQRKPFLIVVKKKRRKKNKKREISTGLL